MTKNIAYKTAKLLLDINAISLRPHQPFEFTSGIKSPIYIDNRLIISYPEVRNKIVGYYIQLIKEKISIDKVQLLSGTSTAAIPWAAFTAQKMNLPMIYVRSKKKKHGKETQIEGKINAGQKTIVIEDHISTGGSLIENAETVRRNKGIVNYALAITTYLFHEAKEKFKQKKIKVIYMTDFETIINVAVEKGFLKEKDKKMVLSWNKNPRKWGN